MGSRRTGEAERGGKRRKEDVGGYERKRWKEVRRGESIRNEYGRTRRKRRVDVRTLEWGRI